MGLLDGLAGAAMGQLGGGGQQNPLLQVALQLVQGQGGIAGLIAKFQGAGLQQQAASWVSTGENLPISGENLAQALGGDTIAAFAQKLGMSNEHVSGGLAGLLPQVVDKLTPNGTIEQGSIEQQLSGLLKNFGR
jgi:uncharacterized protein YidB (DUF937 family)